MHRVLFFAAAAPKQNARAMLISAAALAWCSPCFALTITPTFDSTITSDANSTAIENTINQAIQFYDNTFSDPITVTIKFQEISSGLGSSNWWDYNIPYSTFRAALAADATTANDATALAHLPNVSTNPVTGTSGINVKTANIHALGMTGFTSGLPGGFDGVIGLNTSITFPPNNSSSSTYSLLSVTDHEIDEVLGLGSSLPFLDFNAPFPQDLFRYDSSGNRNFTTSGDNAYFSIDGTNDLARFSQNSAGDYGDWWTAGAHTPQVQDAFATPGATPAPGTELTALDVIGYNLVPEPASATCAGVIALSLLAWRTRRAVAFR